MMNVSNEATKQKQFKEAACGAECWMTALFPASSLLSGRAVHAGCGVQTVEGGKRSSPSFCPHHSLWSNVKIANHVKSKDSANIVQSTVTFFCQRSTSLAAVGHWALIRAGSRKLQVRMSLWDYYSPCNLPEKAQRGIPAETTTQIEISFRAWWIKSKLWETNSD